MKFSSRLILATTFVAAAMFASQCLAESVIAKIPESQPEGMDINPLSGLVYVANFFTPTVSVISERTNTVVDTIFFPPEETGDQAELEGLAVNPATSRLYVTNPRAGILYTVDLRTKKIIQQLSLGQANDVSLNFRNDKIYVTQFFSGNVLIIDGHTNTLTKTIPVPWAQKVSVDLTTGRAYVPDQNFFGSVFVLDGTTDEVLAQISTGSFTTSVGIDFLRHLAYASNDGFTAATSSISVIDTNTNTVVDTIPTDPGPTPLTVNPFTNRIYVATTFQGQDVVDVIDGDSRQVVSKLPIDPQPQFMAIDLLRERLYVSSPNFVVNIPGGNVVTAIDTRR